LRISARTIEKLNQLIDAHCSRDALELLNFWTLLLGDAAERSGNFLLKEADARLDNAPLDLMLFVGETIEGTSSLVFNELDLIVRTLIGDVTEEFDSLVFDELDTIVRTLLEDITDKFNEATNARSDTLVTPSRTENLPVPLEMIPIPSSTPVAGQEPCLNSLRDDAGGLPRRLLICLVK
jgi:hypothetical protein